MIDDLELKKRVETVQPWMVEMRRYFHMNPELSQEEYETRDRILEELAAMGIEARVLAKTGVVGLIEGKNRGRTVGLRADIDALPLDDKKVLAYRSRKKGVMHACGHDAHTSILLGAARVLQDLRACFDGSIKLIFQPAEETVGGAKPMIQEGVLENPRVDCLFGLHVDNSIESGRIGIKYDQMKAASDMISIRVYGSTAHGAYPQDGVDALVIASHIVVALQSLVSRRLDPRKSGVVSIGRIKGGYARNVIADYIEMEGIVRTLDQESRNKTLYNLKELVEGVARSMGGRAELVIDDGYSYLINDREILSLVEENGRSLLGDQGIYMMPYPSFGVEDFAFFAEERPAAFFNLGTGNQDKGISAEGHTELFDIDEDALGIGALLQVKNALGALKMKEED